MAGHGFKVLASHQERCLLHAAVIRGKTGPLGALRKPIPKWWCLQVVVAGGGTDGSAATGDTPHHSINLPEGNGFQCGAKEDRGAFRDKART